MICLCFIYYLFFWLHIWLYYFYFHFVWTISWLDKILGLLFYMYFHFISIVLILFLQYPISSFEPLLPIVKLLNTTIWYLNLVVLLVFICGWIFFLLLLLSSCVLIYYCGLLLHVMFDLFVPVVFHIKLHFL